MSATTGYAGKDAALKMSTNGGSTYVTIPGVRTTGLTIDNKPIDISNAASPGGWQEMLAGAAIRSAEVTVDGVVSTGTAFAAFFAHVQNSTIGLFRIDFGNAGRIDFRAPVARFTETGQYMDAQTFQATLPSHLAPTITAAT
jgi:predicted secreted protein